MFELNDLNKQLEHILDSYMVKTKLQDDHTGLDLIELIKDYNYTKESDIENFMLPEHVHKYQRENHECTMYISKLKK